MAWDTEAYYCPLTGDGPADEPVVLAGCPGPAPAAPDLGQDDDDGGETEDSLSPSDWWDVGYVDGLYALKKKPPLADELAACYRSGFAAGAVEAEAHRQRQAEREKLDAERAAWNLPPADANADIPF